MIIKVSDHLGRRWPGNVAFDVNQRVTSLLSGVAAAAGTHPLTTKGPFRWMTRDCISLKPHL